MLSCSGKGTVVGGAERRALGSQGVPGTPVQACFDVLEHCSRVRDQGSLAHRGQCPRRRSGQVSSAVGSRAAVVPLVDSLPRQLPEQCHRHSLEGSGPYDLRKAEISRMRSLYLIVRARRHDACSWPRYRKARLLTHCTSSMPVRVQENSYYIEWIPLRLISRGHTELVCCWALCD